jgi:hypothetical protein
MELIYISIHLTQFDGLISTSIGNIVKGHLSITIEARRFNHCVSFYLAPPQSTFDWDLSFTPFASPTRELAIAETSNLTVCSTYIARTSYIYLNLY